MMARSATAPGPWTGVWLTLLVLVVSIGAFILARGFVPATTRYFPQALSAACILVALFDIARRAFLGRSTHAVNADGDEALPGRRNFLNEAADAPASVVLRYAGWFFGYLIGVWLVTLVVASGIFVAAFLRYEARTGWWTSLLSGIAVMVFVVAIGRAFVMRWPPALVDPLAFLL